MKFEDLGLNEPILRAIRSEGYSVPTPIQAQAIPLILEGKDLLGCARTGTGKTGAFAMPILHRLSKGMAEQPKNQRRSGRRNQQHSARSIRALILAPTRELAAQIHESFRTYGRNLPLRHTVVFGGVNQFRQVRALQQGVDVLVATPGRLMDLMQQGYIDLSHVEAFILDEADRMLDMGFIHDIRKIIESVPKQRQSLLFSATMPVEIRRLSDTMLNNPVSIEVDPVDSTATAVTQSVYHVARNNKPVLLERLLSEGPMQRTLVFTRTKHGADKVVRVLQNRGIGAVAIHGNKSQNARTHALNGFKSGRSSVLVATDIASRGIDVDEITHVVNFDMPNLPESYVHRIGRTARAGASGVAVSFCDENETGDLRAIERLIKKPLDVCEDHQDLTHKAPIHTAPQSKNGSSKSGRSFNGKRSNNRRRGGNAGPMTASRGPRKRRSQRSASSRPR